MAKPPKKKAPSGTLIDRLNEARNRPYKGTKGGVPERVGRYGKGKLNTARTPDSIKMGGPKKPLPVKPKTVPLGESPKLLSGPAKKVITSAIGVAGRNVAIRAVGVASIFDPSFMSSKTGGAAQAPAPKKYEKPSPYAVTGKGRLRPEVKKAETKKNIVGNNPNRGLSTSKASPSGMTGTGRLRPEVKNTASDFKKKNLAANQKAGKDAASVQPPKAATTISSAAPKKPSFKGNWTGAAATEMQKRGGAKIKRPNLLSLFRKKKK